MKQLNPKPGTPYHTYLLRYWQEESTAPDDTPAWRCVVESVSTGKERWGFSSFEKLMAFLAEKLQADLSGETRSDYEDGHSHV